MFLHRRILQEANGIGNAIHMLTCKLKRVTYFCQGSYLPVVVTILGYDLRFEMERNPMESSIGSDL
jgi:hypothetical protein